MKSGRLRVDKVQSPLTPSPRVSAVHIGNPPTLARVEVEGKGRTGDRVEGLETEDVWLATLVVWTHRYTDCKIPLDPGIRRTGNGRTGLGS